MADKIHALETKVAVLTEALRKIADGETLGCTSKAGGTYGGGDCEMFGKVDDCEMCPFDMRQVARAALDKIESGDKKVQEQKPSPNKDWDLLVKYGMIHAKLFSPSLKRSKHKSQDKPRWESLCCDCAKAEGYRPINKVAGMWMEVCPRCGKNKPTCSLTHDYYPPTKSRSERMMDITKMSTYGEVNLSKIKKEKKQ